MSWTPRLTANNRNGLSTFDAFARTAGSYSGTGTWPNNCAVTNWAAVVAFKTAAGRPRFVQGAADATVQNPGGFSTFNLAMPGPSRAGNYMVVDVAWNAAFALSGCVVSDSAGNEYWPVFAEHGSGAANFLSCWVGKIVAGDGDTLTIQISQQGGTSNAFQAINVAAHEYSGLDGAIPGGVYSVTSDGFHAALFASGGSSFPSQINGCSGVYTGDGNTYSLGYLNSGEVLISPSSPVPPVTSGTLTLTAPPPNMSMQWPSPDGVYLAANPVSSFGGANIVTSSVPTPEDNVLLHFMVCDEGRCAGVVVSGGADPLPGGCPEAWLAINEPGTVSPVTANTWVDQSLRLHLPQPPQVSNVARQRGKATLPIRVAEDDDYLPTIGSQVCVWDKTLDDGSFEIFTGTIDDYEVGPLGNDGFRVITITAVSLEQTLDVIRIKQSKLYEDKTCAFIMNDLLDDYPLLQLGRGVIDDGATLDTLLLTDYPTYSEVFDRLATESGFIWGVDPTTQEVYFHLPDTEAAPFTLESTDVLWEQLTLKPERHDFRNEQILQANANAAITSSELFAGAGQKSFTCLRPVNQIVNAWITKNVQNHAAGTFTANPSPGDSISIGLPTSGSTYNWAPAGTYVVGQIIIDSNGYIQKCAVAGTSGAVEPSWIEILGQTTADNTVEWTNQGQQGFANATLAVYSFVAELDNTVFGEVLIAATLADTIQNLVDAINANRDTAGVSFSLPTWENPLVNAEVTSGTVLTVRNKPAGQGYIATLSDACSVFSWSGSQTSGGVTTFGTDVITFGQKGQTTGGPIFTVVYTPGSAVVESATPLNAGTSLQVEYLATDAGYVRVRNSASVAERARIEGGTGEYQQTSSDDKALSMPEALQLAQSQLESYGTIPETLTFETFRPGIYVGQVLDVNLDQPNYAAALINGLWFVQEIQATMVPIGDMDESEPESFLPDAGRYRYTITCINVAQIGDWIDFWEQRGSGSGGGGGSYNPGGGALGSASVASSSAVSSIAELRGVPVPTASAAFCVVDGYYAAGDGGGGTFAWDGASSATDNGGTVIQTTGYAGVGRWIRIYDGPIFARWFGAKGDGATNDSTAIAAAIAEAAANWLQVAFDGSTYLCSGLTLATDGMSLIGQAGTVLKNSVAGSALLTITADYCSVDLIQFNGNSGIGGSVCSVIINGAHNRFFRCTSFNSTNQGFGLDGQATTCNFNVLEACEAYSNAGIGISQHTAPDNRFVNCWIHDNGLEGLTFDVTSHRSQAVGCRISSNCQTGGVGNIGVDGVDDCIVSGCIITAAHGQSGIKTQNNTGATNRLVVTGCSFQGNGAWGVNLFSGTGGAANNCTITGNDFQGNTSGSILVSATACTGNMIAGNGLNGSAVSDSGTSTIIIQSSGGGVSSVGLSMPAEFTVAGSPVTGAGTLTVTKATKSANLVYAGPASGAAAQPSFRALVSADLPPVTASTHSESLTDGNSNFIFAGGDIVTVVGVPN